MIMWKFEKVNDILVNTEFKEVLLRHGLDCHQAIMSFEGPVPKQKKGRVITAFSLNLDDREYDFFLKKHRNSFGRSLLSTLTGRNLAGQAEWDGMLALGQVGIPSMTPVAFGIRRVAGVETESFTITEKLKNARRLEEYIPRSFQKQNGTKLSFLQRQSIIHKVADLARRLHEQGMHHQDFYFGHLFISDQDDPVISLIDLQRLRRRKPLLKRWKVKDLGQLLYSSRVTPGVTNADRMRFFKRYAGEARLSCERKAFIRQIIRKASRIEQRVKRKAAIAGRK